MKAEGDTVETKYFDMQNVKSSKVYEAKREREIEVLPTLRIVFQYSQKNSEGKLNLESTLYVSSRIQGE